MGNLDSHVLNSIVKKMTTDEQVTNDLEYLLRTIRTHLHMDVAFISEFEKGKRVFRVVDNKEDDNSISVGASDPVDITYCGKIVDGVMPEIIQDTSENNIALNLAVTNDLNIGSYIGVPVNMSDGTVYGTFCCFSHQADNTLNNKDLSLLKMFADLASHQIEHTMKDQHEKEELTKKIRKVIENKAVAMVYQPIFDIRKNQITGFEALARFKSEPYQPPNVWFNEAERVGLGQELELLAISEAIETLSLIPADITLSVNASPDYVVNGAVFEKICTVPKNRMIIEVTEHMQVENYTSFRKSLNKVSRRGVRLAIDDAGAGYASFLHILELGVDIIKLDIGLIKNIHLDKSRYALAVALLAFAKTIGSTVIAEGVECLEEYQALKSLGVDKVQGYFIGKPMTIEEAINYHYQEAC